MSDNLWRIIVTALSLAAHVLAFLQFRLNIGQLAVPHQWQGQFYFLLAISLLMTLLLPICRKRPYLAWLTLIFRAGNLVLIGLPFGGYLGIELTLLGVMIIETFTYTTLRLGLVFTTLITVIVMIIQQPMMVWGLILPAASLHDMISFAVYILMVILLSAFVRYQMDNQVSAAELNRCLNETTIQLAEANLQLQEYAVMTEQEAKANERKRLAREMHDTLAYTLTNLVMMLEAAIDLSSGSKPELRAHLEQARDQAKEGLIGVRSALQALRPIQLEEENGLTAIYHLIQTFTKATRIKVELNLGDAPLNFGEEADWAIYRLVQEGMTNALRHGKATFINISFCRENNGIRVQIKDNGVGVGKALQEGYGLTGMRERIERLGGQLTFHNEAGKGFTLSAWIPLKEG